MIRFYTSLMILLAIVVAGIGAYGYNSLFRASSIASALPFTNLHSPIELSPEISAIFDRPLTYLGEGNQVYAFLSEDSQHVVKFFKACPLQSGSWMDALPEFAFVERYRQKLKKRCQYKFDRIFNAYDIAYTHDRQHTGLSYIHLQQTSHLHLTATATDALGFQHHIDLDKVAFAIQKKGEPLRHLLKREMSAGQWQSVKNRLKQVMEMYLAEYQLGIIDHDHNLMANIGFADGLPIRIDVGKLVFDPAYQSSEVYLADLDKIVHQRIAKWFKRYAPEHTAEAMEALEPYLIKKL